MFLVTRRIFSSEDYSFSLSNVRRSFTKFPWLSRCYQYKQNFVKSLICRFTPRWYLSTTQRPFQIDFGSLSKIGSRNTRAYNILLLMTSYCSIFRTFYRFINESGHLVRYFNVRIRACIYPYGDNVDPVRVTRRLIIFRMHVLMKLHLTHRLDNFIFRFSFVPLKSVSFGFFLQNQRRKITTRREL